MRSSVAKHFGEAIEESRKACAITQEELAARAGLHRTYISQIERGKRQPTLATIFELARALGIRPSNLIESTERALSE